MLSKEAMFVVIVDRFELMSLLFVKFWEGISSYVFLCLSSGFIELFTSDKVIIEKRDKFQMNIHCPKFMQAND